VAEPVAEHPSAPPVPRLLLLTALVPGLGHFVAGRRRTAILLAAPIPVAIAVLLVLVAIDGPVALAARLIDPAVLAALFGVQLLVAGWRLFALAAVYPLGPRPRRTTALAAVVALALVVVPQVWVAGLTLVAREAALEVFEPVTGEPEPTPEGTPPPIAIDDPSPSVPPTPSPTPAPGMEARVNVLLIGMDSGVGRQTALTDTMIVASLDPIGETISMVSIPRDLVDVPLPDGRTFRAKINSLVSYVRWHPAQFPGYETGQDVLAAALGELLGLRVDHWAQVDLGGFVRVVDSVGGIVVNVRRGFCDPGYDEYGINGFGISPGRYLMNGNQALAYARVRKAAGESDFTRAARQQEIIAGLRDRIVSGGLLNDPAEFLRSVGRTARTNIPPAMIADHLDEAVAVPRSRTFRAVIDHPLVRNGFDARGSIQIADFEGIRALAARLFPLPGTLPTGVDTIPDDPGGETRRPSNSTTCGISPTPRPTPAPSDDPSGDPSGSPAPTGFPAPSPTTSPAPTTSPPPGRTPSPAPTAAPTAAPTPLPSAGPSPSPTIVPSAPPTAPPTSSTSP
jgi:LCP family protein required for cell wall assembly